tara:strand:+ start:906 stop:1829 length:924 start_codon:yes stop_codon:yes gene_type:complete
LNTKIKSFLYYLTTEKGSSKNTTEAYKNDLNGFANFVKKNQVIDNLDTIEISQITKKSIEDYVKWLNSREYSRATVARKIAALKSFVNFLVETGDLTKSPILDIESPKTIKSLPKPLLAKEVDAILTAAKDNSSTEGYRDSAMLSLMYWTGLRVSELIALNIDNLYLSENEPYLRCYGKGDRERTIPIPDQALENLKYYLREIRHNFVRNNSELGVFVNMRGERLTRQGYWLILKAYVKKAGIASNVTPHTLRHSYATHLLRGGASIRAVQELLGHANVSTTQIYTQLANQDLKDAYEEVHPRAKIS